ncbi:hypothetical protein [Stenotrophomonas sp. SMYL36]|uniref:hypothetical protein n=1 Tax=Stenotrophomonas sp. SMYL36 TaxID=3076045 RepID=UPI002E772592|nr:hypothetical protein [Stenotrophomonas sp. SMYL36]
MVDLAEPLSWQLVEFLRGRVELIRESAGFRTDIGTGLIVVDDSEVDEDFEGPATLISVRQLSRSGGGSAQVTSDAAITIEFEVPRTSNLANPRLLVHRARHDLIRALTFNVKALPKGITSFDLLETQMASLEDDAGHSAVVAQITARAGLTETFEPVPNP